MSHLLSNHDIFFVDMSMIIVRRGSYSQGGPIIPANYLVGFPFVSEEVLGQVSVFKVPGCHTRLLPDVLSDVPSVWTPEAHFFEDRVCIP